MQKKEINVNLVQQQIGGYEFKNPKLLEQAFIRRSYSEENGGENNEVLEFIGDKVLDIAVVRYLTEKYGTDMHLKEKIPAAFRVPQEPKEFACSKTEGELTKIKQKLVEKRTLAERIDDLGFADFLTMGKGDKKNDMAKEASVKEDLFEAVIGAVALDCNWNLEILRDVVEIMLCPDSYIDEEEETDYVGLIYQWEDKQGCRPWFKYFEGTAHWYYAPKEYVVYGRQGTFVLNHAKYECRVKLLDTLPVFGGYGTSKSEARRAACEIAYKYLEEKELLYTIRDEIDEPSFEMAINQLETLARRGYFSLPEYSYEESHDEDGNPVWHVECRVEEFEDIFESDASSKKQAKKETAFEMLQYILENYRE